MYGTPLVAMVEPQIDQDHVLSQFDRAVASSSISWTPTTPIHLTENGFQVGAPILRHKNRPILLKLLSTVSIPHLSPISVQTAACRDARGKPHHIRYRYSRILPHRLCSPFTQPYTECLPRPPPLIPPSYLFANPPTDLTP